DADELLSTGESALYQRLLAEASRGIVELATELNGFDTALAASTLQDHDKILTMLADLWQRPAQADQEFEDKYRDQVKNQLDKLELFGLPKMDVTTRAQRLTRVYITLQFERHQRIDTDDLIAQGQRSQLSLFDEPEDLALTPLLVSDIY